MKAHSVLTGCVGGRQGGYWGKLNTASSIQSNGHVLMSQSYAQPLGGLGGNTGEMTTSGTSHVTRDEVMRMQAQTRSQATLFQTPLGTNRTLMPLGVGAQLESGTPRTPRGAASESKLGTSPPPRCTRPGSASSMGGSMAVASTPSLMPPAISLAATTAHPSTRLNTACSSSVPLLPTTPPVPGFNSAGPTSFTPRNTAFASALGTSFATGPSVDGSRLGSSTIPVAPVVAPWSSALASTMPSAMSATPSPSTMSGWPASPNQQPKQQPDTNEAQRRAGAAEAKRSATPPLVRQCQGFSNGASVAVPVLATPPVSPRMIPGTIGNGAGPIDRARTPPPRAATPTLTAPPLGSFKSVQLPPSGVSAKMPRSLTPPRSVNGAVPLGVPRY